MRVITRDYYGLRGEGSIPVPLPPSASPRATILCARMFANRPVLAAISDLSAVLQIGRDAHSSPNVPFISGALDSADSVRFSKWECFEKLMVRMTQSR
jgi:hypothetical protein